MKTRFIIFIFFWVFLIFPRFSFAQQISLSLDPPLTEVFIKPGKTLTLPYKINNYGDPIVLSFKVLPFEARDNHGNIKLKQIEDNSIQFSVPVPFFLKTNTQEDIHIKVSVPGGSIEKDYYYVLVATSEPIPTKNSGFLLQSKLILTSNILIDVSTQNISEINGKLTLFDIPNSYKLGFFGKTVKIIDSFDKLPISLIVENKGKNHIKPKGEITLKGSFGNKIVYPLLSDNILAYSQRLIKVSNQPIKDYSRDHSAVLSGFFMGSYNLSANFNFGNNNPIFSTITFIAIPIKLISVLLMVIILALYLIYQRKKSRT